MTSEFIATLQRVENVSHLLSKMGESTVDEAVQRIESICAFMERYGDLGEIFEHFKELESKLFMCREMLTVEEAAEYIGVSKSQMYLMTSNREITHFKPRGKFIYIERKELDDVLRRNVIYSKHEMSRRAAAETMMEPPKGNRKTRKGAEK